MARRNRLYSTGNLGLCDDLGVGWEWDGKEVQEGGGLRYTCSLFTSVYSSN